MIGELAFLAVAVVAVALVGFIIGVRIASGLARRMERKERDDEGNG